MFTRTRLLFAVLIAVAVVRIASTYTTFSMTTDEPIHVGAGLELLQLHTYSVLPANPPLPRIFFALPPTIAGVKLPLATDVYADLQQLYTRGGHYATNLILIRVGNLFFFTLCAIALFAWAKREMGEAEALLATFFLTMEPMILGFSGIANHDLPGAAGFAVAMLVFSMWLRKPDAIRAAWGGAACGFSILCKFSNIPYVALACALMFVAHLSRNADLRRIRAVGTLLIVPAVAAVTIWAGYAFTWGPIHPTDAFSVPAPRFFEGIEQIIALDKCCFTSYAFGRISLNGWWWYFPVAVLLKTTLPLLALLIAGAWFAWRSSNRHALIDGVVSALGVILVAVPSTLDLGVRYVLPMYVSLSFAAAAGAAAMLRDARIARRVAIVLLAIEVVVSAAAHPDYFPYFNALAGHEPGRCLIDSNLDWGQDALRLKDETRRLGIKSIALAIAGEVDRKGIGIPPGHEADAMKPDRGWIAVSEHPYRMNRVHNGWWWLEPYRFRRVGKSIRLYFVPEGEQQPPPPQTVRVLLPIAGTTAPRGQWTVDQEVRNRGSKPAHVELNHCATKPCDFDVAPGQAVRIGDDNPTRPFIWATVPSDASRDLAFTTVARRVDRAISSADLHVPAVPESSFSGNTVAINDVPFTPAQRLNLRIYTANEEGGSALVQVWNGSRVVGEATVPIYATGFYTHGDLQKLFPAIANQSFKGRVTMRSNGTIWAFVTGTELATGASSIFTPEEKPR